MLCIESLTLCLRNVLFFFFFNDTATTEIYTLSLHDALPISVGHIVPEVSFWTQSGEFVFVALLGGTGSVLAPVAGSRSEEHTSELQSQSNLVCRLLLEKKKKNQYYTSQHDHNKTSM